MKSKYIALVWLRNEGEKPERLIVEAGNMADVQKYINKVYPQRKLLTISVANAFDIKPTDEVYRI